MTSHGWLVVVLLVTWFTGGYLVGSSHLGGGDHLENLHFVHHDYEATEAFLESVNRTYPDIAHLYSIGNSVQGRRLSVLALGSSPRGHVTLRPELKVVANMHGNEVVGKEVALHLIKHLVTSYGADRNVTWLLDNSRVHVLVSMNPDGYEVAYAAASRGLGAMCHGLNGRHNANNVDLNRDFRDFLDGVKQTPKPQAETRAIMRWLHTQQFVLSAGLHGGALVANYPFDSYHRASQQLHPQYSQSQDDELFRHLATTYAAAHPRMWKGVACYSTSNQERFSGGITNGAQWYPVVGGMQDYNLFAGGCTEITLELSCCKFPHRNVLRGFVRDNLDAFTTFLKLGHIGVKGIVQDSSGGAVAEANVTVVGHDDWSSRSTHLGEYWRLLLPGEYVLKVKAKEFMEKNVSIHIKTLVEVVNITLVAKERARSSTNDTMVKAEKDSSLVVTGSSLSTALSSVNDTSNRTGSTLPTSTVSPRSPSATPPIDSFSTYNRTRTIINNFNKSSHIGHSPTNTTPVPTILFKSSTMSSVTVHSSSSSASSTPKPYSAEEPHPPHIDPHSPPKRLLVGERRARMGPRELASRDGSEHSGGMSHTALTLHEYGVLLFSMSFQSITWFVTKMITN